MRRRKFISMSAVAGLGGLAGCTYDLEQRRFFVESSPVGIPDFLLDQTIVNDYDLTSLKESREIEYKGDKRDVQFKQWRTELLTEDNNLTQAWFFTQPNRELGGLTINPNLIDQPHDMTNVVDTDWDEYRIGESVDVYKVNMLGTNVNVREFDGFIYTESTGQVDATYLFASTESSDDQVAFFAGLPKDETNENDMVSMIQASIHPFETED